MSEQLKPTTFEELKSYSSNAVIRFPDFGDGKPFIAEVKRVSMLLLAKTGKIPNSLLNAATELFKGGKGKGEKVDSNALGDMYDICYIMAEACLVNPSMQDIKNAGLELTDEQLVEVFNYTQKGVKALKSFRKDEKDIDSIGDGNKV